MLTDDEARTLLHRAADTIDVEPAAPIAAAARPRWPMLVAASAVLAVAVGSFALTRDDRGDDSPIAPTDRVPVERTRTTAPDRDISEPDLAVSLQQLSVAIAFEAWARGAPAPPPFAGEVHLLLEDDEWDTVTGHEAADPDTWSLCSGLPPARCSLNPLRVLDEYDGDVVKTGSLAIACAPDPRHLPDALAQAADDDVVRLDQPEAKNCANAFAVELWISDGGRIYAVNLLP